MERSRILRALILAAAIALVLTEQPGARAGDVPGPHVEGTEDLTFPPPSLTLRQNYSELAAYLAQTLALGRLDLENASEGMGDTCCLVDWQGHYVESLDEYGIWVRSVDRNGTGLWLRYSSSDILEAVWVNGPVGAPLPSGGTSAMEQRTIEIAAQLGLPSPSGLSVRETLAAGPEGPESAIKVSYFLNYSGKGIAFGNELSVTYGTDHPEVFRIEVFPWFAPQPPLVPGEVAYSRALDRLNGSGGVRSVTGKGVYFVFNSLNASLAYQVEAEITSPPNDPAYPLGNYRVWVDAYTGAVAYEVWMAPHSVPFYEPPSGNLWVVLLFLGVPPSVVFAVAFVKKLGVLRRTKRARG